MLSFLIIVFISNFIASVITYTIFDDKNKKDDKDKEGEIK